MLVAAALLAPQADAARYAVGAASASDLRAAPGARWPGAESLAPIPARGRRAREPHRGCAIFPAPSTSSGSARRRPAYVPNDPLAPKQWHLEFNRTFDFWETPPLLPAVRVAVIDSGIDGDHPDFAGKIADAKSFVGGSALVDEEGHGTFVAGLIAAMSTTPSASRASARPPSCSSRRSSTARPDRRRGRGEGDQVGGRAGRARDQHEPRRLPRPARPRPRRVLAARGAGDRLGPRPRRPRRGRRREQRRTPPRPWPYASYPAALAARARRQRARAGRLRPRLLEPRPDLQRHRRARRRASSRRSRARSPRRRRSARSRATRAARPDDYRKGRGDVVRRAAGERRRGGPARGSGRSCGPSR